MAHLDGSCKPRSPGPKSLPFETQDAPFMWILTKWSRAVLEKKKKSQSMFFMLVQSIAGVFSYETYKLLYPDLLKL